VFARANPALKVLAAGLSLSPVWWPAPPCGQPIPLAGFTWLAPMPGANPPPGKATALQTRGESKEAVKEAGLCPNLAVFLHGKRRLLKSPPVFPVDCWTGI